MSCVICARISTVRLTRKWANWASFSGLAAILQMPIRGLLICLKKFDTPNGLAQFFCDWVAPIDKLTDEYPMVLSTVREVGHYSCRSMTGNCAALAALADELATHKSIPKTPNVWVLKMRHWFGCTRVKAKLSPVRRSAIVRTKGRFT